METSICKHLEKLLPQIKTGAVQSYKLPIDEVRLGVAFQTSPQSEEEFTDAIRAYGILDPWDIALLVDYFYNGMSLREIAEVHHYTGREITRLRFKSLIQQLKERGFGQEKTRT